jgi:hypothetical protein
MTFQNFQHQFTAHIRNPQKKPRPPGVPARRMKVYNELLFNNIEGSLLGCFPVLRLVLGKQKWKKLVRDFFAEHKFKTPFYRQIPDEFVAYLQNERGKRSEDPPYLKYLAHYEWIELVLFVAEETLKNSVINPKGDLFSGRPVFNIALKFVSYPFEVHRISPNFKPKKAARVPFHYLVFRNPKDEVEFMTLNAVSARLVQLLLPGKLTGEKALKKIAKELKHSHPEIVKDGGLKILEEFREKGAILGTKS